MLSPLKAHLGEGKHKNRAAACVKNLFEHSMLSLCICKWRDGGMDCKRAEMEVKRVMSNSCEAYQDNPLIGSATQK